MGNKAQAATQELTPQLLEQSCQFIAKHQGMLFTKPQLINPIKAILQFLRQKDPIDYHDGLMSVNPSFFSLIFHPNFSKQMLKCLQLLMAILEEINVKSLAFLKVSQAQELTAIADFILYFTNIKILNLFDSALIRTDIAPATKQQLKELEEKFGEPQINGNLVEKMDDQEKQLVKKSLRVTIISFINLRQQMISKSQSDLKYFSYLEQSLFMLYVKLYFSQKLQMKVQVLNQHFKNNIIIGAYFLSAGSSFTLPSLYETAVIFLQSFLKMSGVEIRQVKNLPDHLFKNLPVVSARTIYEYIVCNVLFSLKYVKEGLHVSLRFSFNRLMSLKLIEEILKKVKISHKTITYYIEELCLQVKVGQIERAYVYEIAEQYSKIEGNNGSEVIKKFLASGNLKYNLKFKNTQIKISQQELMTELEDDADTYQKEYFLTSHKFVLERILFRDVIYNFNDRILWNGILPEIIANLEDSKIESDDHSPSQKHSQSPVQNSLQKSPKKASSEDEERQPEGQQIKPDPKEISPQKQQQEQQKQQQNKEEKQEEKKEDKQEEKEDEEKRQQESVEEEQQQQKSQAEQQKIEQQQKLSTEQQNQQWKEQQPESDQVQQKEQEQKEQELEQKDEQNKNEGLWDERQQNYESLNQAKEETSKGQTKQEQEPHNENSNVIVQDQ